ncbi:MAG TPA: hypothetical protein PLP63_06535 [Saprospiraceae bacterium]|nr:hypothetical protein [Saprospiraceae bacterium]
MGWDADSSAIIKQVHGTRRIANPQLRNQFYNAINEIQQKAGTADGSLIHGGLDCSNCADMIEKATLRSCYDSNGWSAEEVKKINESADWNFEYNQEDAWAYWSAKKFLELCAKNNLSIKFSW